ncbi:MAG: hypothetical protein JXJ20_10015 [Anaerolineae bacterium]|nr:hypothetical protein [Anaerolineae bacterium]
MADFLSTVDDYRLARYYQIEPRKVSTIEDALDFINEVGFCLFYRHRQIELPNLRDATAGDAATAEGRNWNWKDTLAGRQAVFYGRPFCQRPGFVALRLLAPLYALSPAADVGGDARDLAWGGALSAEAKRIADAVAEHGSLSTRMLRQVSGLSDKRDKYRFSRGLAEAQAVLLIAMVRTTSQTRAAYSYIWDTFAHVWPDAARAAYDLSHMDAAGAIIAQYIHTAGAATPGAVAHLFSLDAELVERAASALVEQGRIARFAHQYTVYLVCPDLLPHLDP